MNEFYVLQTFAFYLLFHSKCSGMNILWRNGEKTMDDNLGVLLRCLLVIVGILSLKMYSILIYWNVAAEMRKKNYLLFLILSMAVGVWAVLFNHQFNIINF